MIDFEDAHLYVRCWFLCMAVAWEKNSRVEQLIKRYISNVNDIIHIETPIDDAVYIVTPHEKYFAFRGTKNWKAWINNVKGITKNGFHSGISGEMEKNYKEQLLDLTRSDDRPVYITGQSRGDAESLYSNYILKREGRICSIESVGFSGPFIANREGVEKMKSLHVCNTHIYSDSCSMFPSDPVDDIGAIGGKHYGNMVNVEGSSGVFDHSYRNITTNLAIKMIEWKLFNDAAYLVKLLREGVPSK